MLLFGGICFRMCNCYYTFLIFMSQLFENFHNASRRINVQISRRLIRKNHLCICRNRTRNRYALLFAS